MSSATSDAEAAKQEKIALAKAKQDAFFACYEARRQHSELTDFRLYWEMLGSTLTGREKVIIDADNVPGRRHLFLMPLEPFRLTIPATPPPPDRK